MATKYNTAYAVLLNNGDSQILPISKAQLIELANNQSQGQFGEGTKDVAAALTYLLNKSNSNLDAAKAYTGEQINALDSSQQAQQGYVLTGITQADGKLTAYTETWLDASVVSYQGGDEAGAPTTVKGAIEDIQEKLASLAGEGEGSVQSQIEAAINDLDLPQVSAEGKPITYVSQENGKVSASTGNINAAYVNVDNTNLQWDTNSDGTLESDLTVQSAITYLDSQITALDESAAIYTIVADGASGTNANVYHLVETINGESSNVGKAIEIPKDRTLTYVWLGNDGDTIDSASGTITNGSGNGQSMNFVHYLADGSYALTKVDVSYFLAESEFDTTKGLTVDNHRVGVNVKSGDNYIEISNGAIASKGIDNAISTAVNTAVNALDSEIAAKTENGFSYVMTGVTETDGLLTTATYIGLTDANVKTTTFDSESDLYKLLGSENLPTDLHDALNKIANKVNNTQAGAVNNIVITDGSYIKAINAFKDGNNTYSFTIDDSALGNVAKLQYDELTWNGAETVTILGANPDE